MGFSDFWIQNGNGKEQLKDTKHGVRKEQVDKKFHNLFDAYDANNDGTLEDAELQQIFGHLKNLSGDNVLDANENKRAASIFAEQVGIQDADFQGFVKSVSKASEDIIESEETATDDGGKEIKTKYKDGSTETIAYYPNGDFKWKKIEKKFQKTTYEMEVNGQRKELTEEQYQQALKKMEEMAAQQKSQAAKSKKQFGLENDRRTINLAPQFSNNVSVRSNTTEREEHDQKFSPRYIAESLGVDINSEDGKKILERMSYLPQEALDQIKDGAELKEIMTNNELPSSFDNLSNLLELMYGVTLRNEEELEAAKPQREKLINQIKTAEFLTDFYSTVAGWNDQYTDSIGLFGLGSEGIGYLLNKLGLDGENHYQWADSCREFAERASNLKVLNPEKFNEGFKKIYGENSDKWGIDFNEEAFKELFAIIESGKAVNENNEFTDEYKAAILKAVNFVADNPNESTYNQVMNGIGEALIMIMTLGWGAEAKGGQVLASSTMATFSKAGVAIASRQVNNRLLQGALRYSGQAVKLLGPAINEGTKMYAYTAVMGTASNVANRAIKFDSEENSLEKFLDTEAMVLDNAKGSFAFGAFAGVFGSTVTQKVMQSASKVSSKVGTALSDKFAKGAVDANDVFVTILEKSAPTKIAEAAAFATDVLGFTAFETAMTLVNHMDGFPDNVTFEDVTKLLWEEFKGQGINLGQIKGISYLIMWLSGSRSARMQASKYMRENPQFKGATVEWVNGGKDGYKINLPDGRKIECKNTTEMISSMHLMSRGETAFSKRFDIRTDGTTPTSPKKGVKISLGDEGRIVNTDGASGIVNRAVSDNYAYSKQRTQLTEKLAEKGIVEVSRDKDGQFVTIKVKLNESTAELLSGLEGKDVEVEHGNSATKSLDTELVYKFKGVDKDGNAIFMIPNEGWGFAEGNTVLQAVDNLASGTKMYGRDVPSFQEFTLMQGLERANDRESFVKLRDEIKNMPVSDAKTRLMQAYTQKYNAWSSNPARPDIRMQYIPSVDLTNMDAVKAAKPQDVMKPTKASTVTNPGITFTPNPNGEPAKAYRLIWCDTVEETIAKNNERGIPLELYKDPSTGEYKLGIKHSWDDGYFGVDRESAIVNYDFTAEKPKDWAVVAEDEGAKIFSKTYLNKETGKTANLADIEPGQGMVIVKNPESVVGASAYEGGKDMTSLEEPLGNVDFVRTDVDGHPYGSFNDLVKDITRGKIQANPKDPNSVRFVELVKDGKIEEARQLLTDATKKVETALASKPTAVMKPTKASTITNPGITFTPNPNGEPAKAYRLIWCDTVEETIAKNREKGIPLELYRDPSTGEYKLGIKHSWDDGYFGVDRESAIVNYDYTAEKPSDWAVVAEDEGAQIFSKTYLNKETGKTASLADIEPGQGMVIVKNPEAIVGASAFEGGKDMTSLEEPLGTVDFTRTDVDGHPYGSFNDLVKDITRGKIQANPKDPNSVKFVELVKAGKTEEARQLLADATKKVETALASQPSAIMKPTEATTFGKQEGITFKPNVNPNDPPSNAYKIAWGKTVEETIELNQKNGVPLELVKDESTGEFFLGIKHSWDNEYYRVDRESIIVKYGEGDFAPVAEDNGAHIFTQTYLDAKTGKPIDVSKMKPGEPLQIVKNPNSTVGAVAFEKPTTVTSLEGDMPNVEMARTDVDGHPYGTYEQLAKDIRRGKLVANESDPNSARFIELVKAGKDAEAQALLKQTSLKSATALSAAPKITIDSPEFQAIKTELTDLYKKKKLTDAEKVRVTELEAEVQKQGILVAKSPLIEQIKISMLAKAEPREAFLPDFSNEAQLKEMGFTKKEDGKWYHSNSDWYPDALSDKDVVYVFKRDANGKPIDTGFGPKDELPSLYVRSEDFDNNNMRFVQPSEMKPGQIISVKKCASGTFCILPVGTKIFTSEGIVEVKPGEIVNVKEAKNSVHTSKMSDVPDMYKADPLNPASKELFDLINEYKAKEATMTETEQIQFQARIADAFGRVNRGQKLIEILGTGENAPKTLRDEYDVAARISKAIDEKYLSRIDCSNFDKGLEEAGRVMDEILADKTLNAAQKQAAIMGVMTHMVTTTNLHQHGKGSTPKDVTLALAREKGLPESTIADIEAAYAQADKGYPVLSEFNKAYDVIGQVIRTPEDYKASINGIIRESMKRGQLICEIRCACDSLRDSATGKSLTPREGTLAIMKAIEEVKAEIRAEGLEPPKTSFVFLTFRGKGWDGSLPMSVTQAREVVRAAEENPDMKFGYDVAGPEDTGWGPKAFKEAMDIINQHNEDVKAGRKKGNTIGVTMHAGETPTYEGGEGYKSVLDAIEMGAVRIGHGIQLAKYLKEMERTNPEEFNRVLNMVKEKGITIEICGVCNIQSIPINSEGMEQHAIQTFLDYGIPVTICTDNDAICGTNISKEYTQFLLTGHSNFMDWNAIKQSVRDGVEAAFIPEADKADVRRELESRIAKVQKLYDEKTNGVVLDATNTAPSPIQPNQPIKIGVIDLFGKKKGIAFSNTKDFSHGQLVAGAIESQLKGQNVEVVPIELKATDPEGKRDRMVTTSYSMGSDSYGSKTNLYFNKKSFLKELKKLNALPKGQKFQYLNVSNIIEVPYSVNGREITPQDLADPAIREEIRKSLPEQVQHIIEELETMIEDGTEVYISAGNKRTTFNALSLAKGAHSIGGLDPKTGEPLSYFTNNALVEDFVPIPLSFTGAKGNGEIDADPTVKGVRMAGIIDQQGEFSKMSKRELRQKVATNADYVELKQHIDKILADGKRRVDINFFQYSLAFNLPEKFRYKIYDTQKFIAMFEGKVEQEVLDYIRPMGTHCDIRYKQFFDMDAKEGHHIMPMSKTTLVRNTISGTSFAPGQVIAREIKAKKNDQ